MDPIAKLKNLEERARQRSQERQAQLTETQEMPRKPTVVPFPEPWAETMRACPLAILRSALFGVVQRGRRRHLYNAEIISWKGASIRYKGDRLDQADLDVWMQAVHLFRHYGLGERLHISAHSFLKAIGRATGKSDHDWLNSSFTRMVACAVKIHIGRYSYAGNLVHEFWLDEETGHYVLSINPLLAALFVDGYSHIEWAQRQALGTKDLAKWLLGYISTHQTTVLNPHWIGLEKLQRLCGSEAPAKEFKRKVKRYMDELKALGAVAAWRFAGVDDDTLEFIRPPQWKSRKSGKNRV
jgi:hypothetical protein